MRGSLSRRGHSAADLRLSLAGSGVGRVEHRHQRQSRGGHRKRLSEAVAELAAAEGRGLLGGRREYLAASCPGTW